MDRSRRPQSNLGPSDLMYVGQRHQEAVLERGCVHTGNRIKDSSKQDRHEKGKSKHSHKNVCEKSPSKFSSKERTFSPAHSMLGDTLHPTMGVSGGPKEHSTSSVASRGKSAPRPSTPEGAGLSCVPTSERSEWTSPIQVLTCMEEYSLVLRTLSAQNWHCQCHQETEAHQQQWSDMLSWRMLQSVQTQNH